MSSELRSPPRGGYWRDVRRGYVAMMPLWPGAVPFGLAFAILARTAGFSALATQALSLFIFAGAAQVATVTLYAGGAGAVAIVLTVLLLNLRHVLYGLSLRQWVGARTRPPWPVLAYLLTDEAYGIAVRAFLDGRGSVAYFLGCGLSIFSIWQTATAAGVLLGTLLPNPKGIGLDFIFALTFLALVLPLIRSWRHVAVVAVAAVAALVLSHYFAGGVTVLLTVLLTVLIAATLGAVLEQWRPEPEEAPAADRAALPQGGDV
jgi:4-azaleucine resistance transporter AzlC